MEQHCLSSLKNQKKLLLNFHKILPQSYNNGNPKGRKFVKGSENEKSKFVAKKWCVIDSETSGTYSENEQIKFLTRSIESSLCDYSDAYILVTGNITATPNNAATQVVFKNCAPFEDCRTEINDTFVDYANFLNITMPMYNLTEYSDDYSNTSC